MRECGIEARANGRVVDIVKQVERSELEPDPRHITDRAECGLGLSKRLIFCRSREQYSRRERTIRRSTNCYFIRHTSRRHPAEWWTGVK